MVTLFVGVALVNTAIGGANAASTLVGARVVGLGWSGLPNALAVLGTAAGTFGLSRLMARRGRRTGLLFGYAVAVVGALAAFVALTTGKLLVLFLGMALVGVGNGAAQLSRYAAADLYPTPRRGWALSSIVWAGTVGGVVGPNLLSPASTIARTVELPPLAGAFLIGAVVLAAAVVAATILPRRSPPRRVESAPDRGEAAPLLRRTALLVAIVAMVTAQFDMSAVMTMTPLAMSMNGQGLGLIGGVLSIHIVGMFALSPLSGELADRWGGATVVAAGAALLTAATITAALSPVVGLPLLVPGLFLLGYGWNLCFVGASTLLSRHVADAGQTRVQGSVDTVMWIASAFASMASGGLLAIAGYTGLVVAAGAVTVVPLTVMLGIWRRAAVGSAQVEAMLADGQLATGGNGSARLRGPRPEPVRGGDEQDDRDAAS